MNTLKIVNKIESQEILIGDRSVILHRHGITDLPIEDWLNVKKILSIQVNNGHIHPECEESEKLAIQMFREEARRKFSSMGIPAVKIALQTKVLSSDVLNNEAEEWLHEIEEAKLAESISIAREANQISREAKELSRKGVRWAMWSAVIAVLALAVSIKSDILNII